MGIFLNLEIKGLPPVEGDETKSAILIADAKDMMQKSDFKTIRNKAIKLEIEFQARAASGFSDPLRVITGITIALEKAGAYLSRAAIRDLSYIRRTGAETKYFIRVSASSTEIAAAHAGAQAEAALIREK